MDMQIITKKDFKDIITSRESCCVANFKKKHFEYKELEELLLHNIDTVNYLRYEENRTAEIKGKYILFSNGSRLDINDNEFNKYTMYIYRYASYSVLASECKWYDTCDNEWYYQTLYYII